MRSRYVRNSPTHCSRRKEWFHGPSGEPVIVCQSCNPRGETLSRTKHDISSADKKDIEVIISWSEGCPVCERVDRTSSATGQITHLSIRVSFVGSIELLRDAALDDPCPSTEPPMSRAVVSSGRDSEAAIIEGDAEGGGQVLDWGDCGVGRRGEGERKRGPGRVVT